MQPITVSTTVAAPIDRVFAFLDVTANHERFTDHFMRDWSCSGPPSGVGSRVRVTATLGGRSEPVDIETIAASAPREIVERNTSSGGRRVATGTYRLRSDGTATTVTFEYAVQRTPLLERLAAPLVRRAMRQALTRTMQRLPEAVAAAG